MGTFTITQIQAGKEIWLYPSSDGCVTDFLFFGDATNYLCVDELKDASDDDLTYVYSDATSIATDLYGIDLTELVGLTGTINYVQIYARGKSDTIAQHENGIYKILINLDTSGCSEGGMYHSDDKDLITSYTTFNYVWNNNPATSASWQWSDFSDFQMGIEVSSPTIYASLAATFRPNAVGDHSEHWPVSVCNSANYTCVDEVSADDSFTIVRNVPLHEGSNPTTLIDLYNIPNHTQSGTITKVSVFFRARKTIGEDPDGVIQCRTAIKTGGTEYYGTNHDLSTQFEYYSEDYASNPSTGLAWTWAEIDALQIGIKSYVNDQNSGYDQMWCTQVYAIVYYEANINPEIRTTQVYAKINYDETSECTLNKPVEVSVDHQRNLKMLNFWSGDRVVYDIGRSKKTMVIQGTQYGPSACSDIACIKAMGKDGHDITTNGLGSDFDDTFKILSIGWKKIGNKPLRFDWILELEYTEL